MKNNYFNLKRKQENILKKHKLINIYKVPHVHKFVESFMNLMTLVA